MRTIQVSVMRRATASAPSLTFTSRSAPVEEPHYWWRVGVRTIFDYTRFTQFGDWSGWIEVDGVRHEMSPTQTWGSRDRSWGIRPTGEPAPSGAPVGEPQFFWLWAPGELPEPLDALRRQRARRRPTLARGGRSRADRRRPRVDAHGRLPRGVATGHTLGAVVRVRPRRLAGPRAHRRAAPRFEFQMSGLGYGHPRVRPRHRGVANRASPSSASRCPSTTPCSRQHIHVQAVCDATYTSPDGTTEHGVGILEQLAIGVHPTGLTGIFDPYHGHGWST